MPVPHHSVFTGQMPFLPPNRVKALKKKLRRISLTKEIQNGSN